jgi:hypothetical protein
MSSEKEREGTSSRDQGDPQEKQTQLMTELSGRVSVVSPTESDRAESTVLDMSGATRSELLPMWLERIEPSLGRGERLRLEGSHRNVSLGRAEESDVRLYTASASREHAVITENAAGEWELTVSAGKSVSIDGEMMTEPVVLEIGMNVILGQDHLRCVSEGLAQGEGIAQAEVDQSVDQGSGARLRSGGHAGAVWWAIGFVAVVGGGLILFALSR